MVTFQPESYASGSGQPMKTWIPDARNFAYLNWKQVDALPRESTLLVLPTAAIEQHGHHLPLATDTLINNLLLGTRSRNLPAELPVYALPPVHYGKSNEHIGFPGTLSVSASTFMAVLRDLGASLSKAGFQETRALQHARRKHLTDRRDGPRPARRIRAANVCPAWLRRNFVRRLDPQERPTASTPAKWRRRFCWRACRNLWIAPPTPSITSRTSPNLNAAAGKRSCDLCLAHSRHCGERRDGRPASGLRGKRRALAGTGGNAVGGGSGSNGPLSGPQRNERYRTGRLRQWRAPGTGRALPHVRRRGVGFRSLLSAVEPVPTPPY